MRKRFSLVMSLLLLLSVVSVNAMPIKPIIQYNTMNYNLKGQTTVQSNTARVELSVYATVLSEQQKSMEAKVLKKLESITPKAKWHVSNYYQSENKSGALEVTLKLHSRLTLVQIQVLTKTIKTATPSAQKMKIDNIDYTPTDEAVAKAKSTLMIKLYKNIQTYVKTFNKETGSSYFIQSVSFNDDVSRAQNVRPMMLRDSASTAAKSTSSHLSVSKQIRLSAYVTLATEPKQ